MGCDGDWLAEEVSARRRVARGENRLPPAAAVVAGAAYGLLPDAVLVAPTLVIPAAELVPLVALLVSNPRRMIRQTRWSRTVSVALVVLIWAPTSARWACWSPR